jgi:Ca2+-binding EF-hand superfamily protein
LLGRTTIEGWLCDRPGIIYDIDQNGEISSKKLYDPPNDINKFSSKTIIGEIIKTYELAL